MDQHMTDFMKLDDAFEYFIKNYVDSFVKWEIIQFFHSHQLQIFSVAELARQINRPAKTLKSELHDLSTKGFLAETQEDQEIIYSFEPGEKQAGDQELGVLLDQFIEFCKTREGRLRVIYKILKDGKPIKN